MIFQLTQHQRAFLYGFSENIGRVRSHHVHAGATHEPARIFFHQALGAVFLLHRRQQERTSGAAAFDVLEIRLRIPTQMKVRVEHGGRPLWLRDLPIELHRRRSRRYRTKKLPPVDRKHCDRNQVCSIITAP